MVVTDPESWLTANMPPESTFSSSADLAVYLAFDLGELTAGSSATFAYHYSIPDFTDSLEVISPNGGESWTAGTSHDITWTSTGTIANVNIDYSTNSGGSWNPVAANTANDGTLLLDRAQHAFDHLPGAGEGYRRRPFRQQRRGVHHRRCRPRPYRLPTLPAARLRARSRPATTTLPAVRHHRLVTAFSTNLTGTTAATRAGWRQGRPRRRTVGPRRAPTTCGPWRAASSIRRSSRSGRPPWR